MPKKAIVFDEAIQIIEAELIWCETDGQQLIQSGYVSQEFHDGFVAGLNQAIRLLRGIRDADPLLDAAFRKAES